MDYIRSYVVTVDPREDGSVDITYDIDWQVIDGDKTDYLSWVKIGLANSSVDELTPLTDTISDLQYTSDGGSYAKVVFRHRYYAPEGAAQRTCIFSTLRSSNQPGENAKFAVPSSLRSHDHRRL